MKTILALGLICSTSAFAGTGLEITTLSGGHEQPGAIHAVASNKLVAVGSYSATRHGGLARYLANGALDISFGGNGKVGTLVGTATTLSQFDTAQGKIIAIGEFNSGNCPSPLILRYNDNGTLDTSLGGQGMVFPAIGDCNHANAGILTDVKIDSNNRIVISGVSSVGHAVIARFSWSGNPDNDFGSQGVFDVTQAVKNVGADASNLSVSSLRLANGNIIVTGTTAAKAMIARVTGSGTFDVSFGFGGVVVSPPYFPTTDSGEPSQDSWTWAKPLSDGSILVVGDTRYNTVPECQCLMFENPKSLLMIGRYLSDGMLDTSYGGNSTGRAAYHVGNYRAVAAANGALDSHGRLVVGASGTNAPVFNNVVTSADYVAARFTASGLLDTTFNGVGYTHFAFASNPTDLDYVSGMTVDSTDRPVLLGSPDGSGFGLGCLTTGGVLDTTFGP